MLNNFANNMRTTMKVLEGQKITKENNLIIVTEEPDFVSYIIAAEKDRMTNKFLDKFGCVKIFGCGENEFSLSKLADYMLDPTKTFVTNVSLVEPTVSVTYLAIDRIIQSLLSREKEEMILCLKNSKSIEEINSRLMECTKNKNDKDTVRIMDNGSRILVKIDSEKSILFEESPMTIARLLGIDVYYNLSLVETSITQEVCKDENEEEQEDELVTISKKELQNLRNEIREDLKKELQDLRKEMMEDIRIELRNLI